MEVLCRWGLAGVELKTQILSDGDFPENAFRLLLRVTVSSTLSSALSISISLSLSLSIYLSISIYLSLYLSLSLFLSHFLSLYLSVPFSIGVVHIPRQAPPLSVCTGSFSLLFFLFALFPGFPTSRLFTNKSSCPLCFTSSSLLVFPSCDPSPQISTLTRFSFHSWTYHFKGGQNQSGLFGIVASAILIILCQTVVFDATHKFDCKYAYLIFYCVFPCQHPLWSPVLFR